MGSLESAFGSELDRLKQQFETGSASEKLEAAGRLGVLGVKERGSIRTRGSLSEAAPRRLPDEDALGKLVAHLEDQDRGLRCQVARALSEWGGEEEAASLMEALERETDENVQLYLVSAIGTIGGRVAVEALDFALEAKSASLQKAAVSAIEELATGGRIEDTESPSGVMTPRGLPAPAVGRGKGARRRGGQAGGISKLLGALDNVRAGAASPYVRLQAGELLDLLDDQ